MRLIPIFLAGLSAIAVAGRTHAQISYQFADSTGTPTNSFNVEVESTVAIRIYLFESTSGAPTLSANGGLGSAAVRLSYSNAAAANIPNLTTGAVPATPPWLFGTTNNSVANASAVLNNASNFSTGVTPVLDRVLLGTFTFTGQSIGVSNLTAGDPNPSSNTDTTYFVGGAGMDTLIGSSNAVLTVVAPVPEPFSPFAALGGSALVVWGFRMRRQSRQSSR
jgi:hypothetical protein